MPANQPCTLDVGYDSGERLTFTADNQPAADWEIAVYTAFAEWFSGKGEEGLYPSRDNSEITRLTLAVKEAGIRVRYGGWNVDAAEAINGETYLLGRDTYDYNLEKETDSAMIAFPEGYYASVTEIIAGTDLLRQYDFSYFDHDDGYYGMGVRPEDPETEEIKLSLEYASGKRVHIETRKISEILALKPVTDALLRYHEALFE